MSQEQNKEMAAAPPLEIGAVVRLIDPKDNLLGFATVTLNDAVVIADIRVLKDKDGNLFAGMPSKPSPGSRTGYSPIVRIKDDTVKAQLNETVLSGYYEAVEALQQRAATLSAEKPPRIAEQMKTAAKEATEHNASLPKPAKGKDKSAEH